MSGRPQVAAGERSARRMAWALVGSSARRGGLFQLSAGAVPFDAALARRGVPAKEETIRDVPASGPERTCTHAPYKSPWPHYRRFPVPLRQSACSFPYPHGNLHAVSRTPTAICMQFPVPPRQAACSFPYPHGTPKPGMEHPTARAGPPAICSWSPAPRSGRPARAGSSPFSGRPLLATGERCAWRCRAVGRVSAVGRGRTRARAGIHAAASTTIISLSPPVMGGWRPISFRKMHRPAIFLRPLHTQPRRTARASRSIRRPAPARPPRSCRCRGLRRRCRRGRRCRW